MTKFNPAIAIKVLAFLTAIAVVSYFISQAFPSIVRG